MKAARCQTRINLHSREQLVLVARSVITYTMQPPSFHLSCLDSLHFIKGRRSMRRKIDNRGNKTILYHCLSDIFSSKNMTISRNQSQICTLFVYWNSSNRISSQYRRILQVFLLRTHRDALHRRQIPWLLDYLHIKAHTQDLCTWIIY